MNKTTDYRLQTSDRRRGSAALPFALLALLMLVGVQVFGATTNTPLTSLNTIAELDAAHTTLYAVTNYGTNSFSRQLPVNVLFSNFQATLGGGSATEASNGAVAYARALTLGSELTAIDFAVMTNTVPGADLIGLDGSTWTFLGNSWYEPAVTNGALVHVFPGTTTNAQPSYYLMTTNRFPVRYMREVFTRRPGSGSYRQAPTMAVSDQPFNTNPSDRHQLASFGRGFHIAMDAQMSYVALQVVTNGVSQYTNWVCTIPQTADFRAGREKETVEVFLTGNNRASLAYNGRVLTNVSWPWLDSFIAGTNYCFIESSGYGLTLASALEFNSAMFGGTNIMQRELGSVRTRPDLSNIVVTVADSYLPKSTVLDFAGHTNTTRGARVYDSAGGGWDLSGNAAAVFQVTNGFFKGALGAAGLTGSPSFPAVYGLGSVTQAVAFGVMNYAVNGVPGGTYYFQPKLLLAQNSDFQTYFAVTLGADNHSVELTLTTNFTDFTTLAHVDITNTWYSVTNATLGLFLPGNNTACLIWGGNIISNVYNTRINDFIWTDRAGVGFALYGADTNVVNTISVRSVTVGNKAYGNQWRERPTWPVVVPTVDLGGKVDSTNGTALGLTTSNMVQLGYVTNIGGVVYFVPGNGQTVLSNASGVFTLMTSNSGASAIYQTTAGVGIGTNKPAAALHVHGDLTFNGFRKISFGGLDFVQGGGNNNIGFGGNNVVGLTVAENASVPGTFLPANRILGWASTTGDSSLKTTADTALYRAAAGVAATTNLQVNGGTIFKSNAFTVAQITATITNGDCWAGMLSNAYQTVCMSNNAVNFKVLWP